MKEFIIQKNEENQRFDKYLKKLLPNASTSFLYKMMRKKNIVINKKKVEGNEKLKAGVIPKYQEEAFREAFAAGFTELWQLEEYFDLPEADIQAALHYWTHSRGIDFTKREAE